MIFIFVLFYFHLTAQLKKPREPFEIYETQYESRQQLDTLNSQRQPFLFKIDGLCPLTYTTTLAELAQQESTIISLIDGSTTSTTATTATTATTIPMSLKECISMVSYYKHYTCFGNIAISSTGDPHGETSPAIWNTISEEFDETLAPSMIPFMYSSQISIMCGGAGSNNVPEYHTQTAKYIVILCSGGNRDNSNPAVTIKLTSLRNYEKLNGGKCLPKFDDYGSAAGTQYTHFFGTTDIWNIEQNIKLQKIPFLEFDVGVGYAISIPPFTVWSIKYNHPATVVFSVNYISFMNSIANIGNWWQSNPFNDFAIIPTIIEEDATINEATTITEKLKVVDDGGIIN